MTRINTSGGGEICNGMGISSKKLLNDMVLWVNGLPDLTRALDIIHNEIRRLSVEGRVTAEEVQSLGSFLTQVRLLLNELQRIEDGTDVVSNEMYGKYLQLESMIKILRDDLDEITMRIEL